MLYNLPFITDDDAFKEMVSSINTAYYPDEDYKKMAGQLPGWEDLPDADIRLKEINDSLKKIIGNLCNHSDHSQGLYEVYDTKGNKLKNRLPLPYLGRFHRFFLDRKWTYPYLHPRREGENIFRLHPPDPLEIERSSGMDSASINYSKNCGDHIHFRNVVNAAARLIYYFSDKNNIASVIKKPGKEYLSDTNSDFNSLSEQLSYKDGPNNRTFKLMLAAFYHDLGKTVDYHRHGMEGATILANNVMEAVFDLQHIVKAYGEKSFDRDDLLFISLLIFYHDQFGTLGTGEAGYLRLVDLIHRIRSFSVKTNLDDQKIQGRRSLFDLWVLNLADIMVSLDNRKFERQMEYESFSESQKAINRFLCQEKSRALQHDLRVALKLSDQHNIKHHEDDLTTLESSAMDYARRHVVERIKRLLRCLLVDRGEELQYLFGYSSDIYKIIEKIRGFPDSKWNSTISRSIYSEGDYTEFAKRFSWIGQLDYAFVFFNKIVERALFLVSEGPNYTNWIIDNPKCDREYVKEYDDEFLARINAEFFLDNYTSTVMQILEHLLFREKEIDRMRNMEFWVAGQRLTNEKIDRIITIEGPFRTRRSVQLALESIFIW